jgi:hypothetical protein
MNEKNMNSTGRKSMKRGACAVAGAVGLVAFGSIFTSCNNDSLSDSIDPDIYINSGTSAKADP